MGILDPISIIGAVADVISSAINSSSNEEIARIQAENHRKEQNVKNNSRSSCYYCWHCWINLRR